MFSLAVEKNFAFQQTLVKMEIVPILTFGDGVFLLFLETNADYFSQSEESFAFNIIFDPVFLVSCLKELLHLRNFFFYATMFILFGGYYATVEQTAFF